MGTCLVRFDRAERRLKEILYVFHRDIKMLDCLKLKAQRLACFNSAQNSLCNTQLGMTAQTWQLAVILRTVGCNEADANQKAVEGNLTYCIEDSELNRARM